VKAVLHRVFVTSAQAGGCDIPIALPVALLTFDELRAVLFDAWVSSPRILRRAAWLSGLSRAAVNT